MTRCGVVRRFQTDAVGDRAVGTVPRSALCWNLPRTCWFFWGTSFSRFTLYFADVGEMWLCLHSLQDEVIFAVHTHTRHYITMFCFTDIVTLGLVPGTALGVLCCVISGSSLVQPFLGDRGAHLF